MEIAIAGDERLIKAGFCRYFDGARYIPCDIYLTDKRVSVSSADVSSSYLELDIPLKEVLDTWRSLKETPPQDAFIVHTGSVEYQFLLDDPAEWTQALGVRLGIIKGPAALP